MNFLLDLLFTSLREILTYLVTALFQVPLDVLTSYLTSRTAAGV